jgi:hypothetical protein
MIALVPKLFLPCTRSWLTVQPPNVFLLLLVVDIVGDEERKTRVDATLLKVLFKKNLEVFIEVVERGTLWKVSSMASQDIKS